LSSIGHHRIAAMISSMKPLRSIKSALGSVRVLVALANDALLFFQSTLRSRTSLVAENLFLRKQLAFYQEHQIKPRRLADAARFSLIFWSRFFEWKPALLVVKPTTLIGWHRKAFRLFWKWKSRAGRPRIPSDLRQLIGQLVRDNPT
jgi:putative transposase